MNKQSVPQTTKTTKYRIVRINKPDIRHTVISGMTREGAESVARAFEKTAGGLRYVVEPDA